MVNLYVADVSSLPNPEKQPELLKQLPKERRQKIQKSLQEKNRKQSMGAGLLLNRVLALYRMDLHELRVNEYGKPEMDGLQFNLSHSGNLVICAVSDKPVGCDVEELRKAPKSVAEHFFCENEKKYLEQFTDEQYDDAFFRLWTMKESYVKMTGEGMRLPLRAYELLMGEQVKVLRDGEIQTCSIKEYEVLGYRMAVCSEDAKFAEIIWENL